MRELIAYLPQKQTIAVSKNAMYCTVTTLAASMIEDPLFTGSGVCAGRPANGRLREAARVRPELHEPIPRCSVLPSVGALSVNSIANESLHNETHLLPGAAVVRHPTLA